MTSLADLKHELRGLRQDYSMPISRMNKEQVLQQLAVFKKVKETPVEVQKIKQLGARTARPIETEKVKLSDDLEIIAPKEPKPRVKKAKKIESEKKEIKSEVQEKVKKTKKVMIELEVSDSDSE